jgi:hypothetical protein
MPACSLTIASGTYLEGVTALAVRDPTSPVATEVVAIALSTTRGRAARRSTTLRSAGGWSTRACRKRTAPTRCRGPQRSSPGGTVTAGNSSGINDGAAALLVASERAVQQYGLAPLARVTAGAAVGVEPQVMGIGPEPATRKLLDRTGLGVADLDVIEPNESVRLAVAGRAVWPRPACPRRARQPERRGDRARPPAGRQRRPLVLTAALELRDRGAHGP